LGQEKIHDMANGSLQGLYSIELVFSNSKEMVLTWQSMAFEAGTESVNAITYLLQQLASGSRMHDVASAGGLQRKSLLG
jgi:hypothetical protein